MRPPRTALATLGAVALTLTLTTCSPPASAAENVFGFNDGKTASGVVHNCGDNRSIYLRATFRGWLTIGIEHGPSKNFVSQDYDIAAVVIFSDTDSSYWYFKQSDGHNESRFNLYSVEIDCLDNTGRVLFGRQFKKGEGNGGGGCDPVPGNGCKT